MRKICLLLVVISIIMVFPSASNFAPDMTQIPEEAKFDPVIIVDIGDGEKELGYTPRTEGIANDGPASFAIDENAKIYILDTLNKKLMVFKDFQWEQNMDISYTEHAGDILYHKGYLYLLDETNKVYKLDLEGEVREVFNLPNDVEAYMVEKLAINNSDEIVVQTDGKEHSIVNGLITEGYTLNHSGEIMSIIADVDNHSQIYSKTGNIFTDIYYTEGKGCVELLDGDSNDNTYIAVQEDIPDSQIVLIEYTIRKIDKNGSIIGYARIPLEDYYNFPNRFANITSDGQIYIMALKEKYVEISKVTLGKKYNSHIDKLKEKARIEKEKYADKNDKTNYIYIEGGPGPYMPSRSDVTDRADDMISLSWTYNSVNAANPPSSVTKPDYLSGISNFPSSQTGIPYCWGGFDGIDRSSSSWSSFLDAMSKGKYAGNVNCTGYYKSGTAGLDCSGFVSAAYTLNTKYNCTQLHDAGLDISYDSIKSMDMFVCPGSHVLLFDSWNSSKTTAYSKETTTTGDDKTKNYSRTKTWLTTNGYYATTFWF